MRGTLRLLFALLLLTPLVGGCSLERRYEVKGRIVGFGDDGRTVIVEHEEIPGLMPAMTMPFKTTETGILVELAEQQAIGFTLVVNRDSSWIVDVRGLPDSSVAAYPAGTPDPAYQSSAPPLRPGESAPDAALVDQDDTPFHLADFKGRAVVLTFIYTRCPLPEYCPLMSRHFQRLQPRLQQRFGDRAHLLSLSFDPEYDTPSVLHAYARRYTDDTTTWTFATGTPETIASLARAFGIVYEAEDGGTTFVHNLATVLLAPDGRIQRIWRGNDWSVEDVEDAVAQALGG